MTGRLTEHLEWTYIFPTLHYPMRNDWISKLYTKLLWVWLLVGTALALSLSRAVRAGIYRNQSVRALLLMGTVALYPVVKSQASHFAFPGAACLVVFSAVVIDMWTTRVEARGRRSLSIAVVSMAVACLVSGLLYQPSALGRFVGMKTYAEEAAEAAAIRRIVAPDEYAIFVDSGLAAYWPSRRYPNWPVLHTDVQATYLMQTRPAALLSALDDPRLVLVEYNTDAGLLADTTSAKNVAVRAFFQAFILRLKSQFVRASTEGGQSRVLWVRAGRTATVP
jgi:hypothetical protein